MDNNDADNDRQADLAEKFLRQLINRLPAGAEAEKLLGKVEEIYIAELREHINQHTEQARDLEQSGHGVDALIHSLLVELYDTLLEKALFDSRKFHK
jgi:hypothetical protein